MTPEAREQYNCYMRQYYKKNRAYILEYRRKWNLENKTRVKNYKANYWARKAEQLNGNGEESHG